VQFQYIYIIHCRVYVYNEIIIIIIEKEIIFINKKYNTIENNETGPEYFLDTFYSDDHHEITKRTKT